MCNYMSIIFQFYVNYMQVNILQIKLSVFGYSFIVTNPRFKKPFILHDMLIIICTYQFSRKTRKDTFGKYRMKCDGQLPDDIVFL